MPSKATADSPLLKRLNAILAEQAREYAVIDRDISLTYAQLDAISDALAGGLAELAHPVVGLYMDRSALSVVAAVAAAKAGVDMIREMGQQLGIPSSLKELGVWPEDFSIMAENAQKDVCCLTNPRTATKEQIIQIFQRAYDGTN